MQLCSEPRGARGIEPETFRRRGQRLSRPPTAGPACDTALLSTLRLVVVHCWGDLCFGSWVLLGLFCLLRVTHCTAVPLHVVDILADGMMAMEVGYCLNAPETVMVASVLDRLGGQAKPTRVICRTPGGAVRIA